MADLVCESVGVDVDVSVDVGVDVSAGVGVGAGAGVDVGAGVGIDVRRGFADQGGSSFDKWQELRFGGIECMDSVRGIGSWT